MLAHWLFAAFHLLAFGLGFWAVLTRGTNFRRLAKGVGEVRSVLIADNLWGVCALILLVTGGMRAFGGYEKGTDYYLHQPLFHLKMTLFVLILLLEGFDRARLRRVTARRLLIRQGEESDDAHCCLKQSLNHMIYT